MFYELRIRTIELVHRKVAGEHYSVEKKVRKRALI